MLKIFLFILLAHLLHTQLFLCTFAQSDFRDVALRETNKYRALHGSPPLHQSFDLNQAAQAHANKLARENSQAHSNNDNFSENIYGSNGKNFNRVEAVRDAIYDWYSEEKKYNFNRPGYQNQAGHFTALVWKNSKYQGIGVAYNSNSKYTVVVANYSPPGNFGGSKDYKENVQRPNSK